MRNRTALAAAVVALATGAGMMIAVPAGATHSSLPLPIKQAFYRYTGSTPLAKIAPGTILKQRAIDISIGGAASTPIPAEQLLYRTKDELGKPAVTVTTVIAPTGGAVATGIVSYLSFYDALGSECDPSYTLDGGYAGTSGNEEQAGLEEGLIANYAGQGYAVDVPDFEGEGLHWAAGQESGWSTLDGLRATEKYLKLPTSTKVGLTGYSGGSIAADWAAELQKAYAPKLNLVGVAMGGIPVDFAHNLKYINGSQDWSGVIPAVLVSLSRAFGVGLDKYLSPKGLKITKQVHNQCIGSFLGNYPGLTVQSLLKKKYRNFLAIPVFARIVNKLTMGTAPGHPAAPLFMGVGDADGTGDGVMVTRDVEALAHEYCQQGSNVNFSVYDNSNHDEAAVQFEPAADTFLQQAFAGNPPASGCAKIGKGNSLKPLKVKKSAKKHHGWLRHAVG